MRNHGQKKGGANSHNLYLYLDPDTMAAQCSEKPLDSTILKADRYQNDASETRRSGVGVGKPATINSQFYHLLCDWFEVSLLKSVVRLSVSLAASRIIKHVNGTREPTAQPAY